MPRRRPRPEQALALGLASEAMLGVLALLLGFVFGYSPLATLSVSGRAIAIGAAAAIPMLAFFGLLFAIEAAPLVRIRLLLDEVIGSFFARSSVAELALISAAAGVCEELLFRGFIQAVLNDFMWAPVALVVASVVFGLAHPITGAYVILATGAGLYLGWLWMATGNLAVPIVTHFVYDFVALVALVRQYQRRAADGTGTDHVDPGP